ncbi:MAG: AAA family ATPase [Luteococcus sp.]|uniref:HelD family protein n=1 Tax=Luteococcus sp. TaxID=1969402 RepID=UPI00264A42E1|nr:UvrD-helicase domain-containing protein [Luteococcus sp.]MDN5564085.1 AAA family ATPase [Luteococcus sp.]
MEREIALEQRHVDRVHAQLEVATASAKQVQAEGQSKFVTDRGNWMREEDGTALFERDAFAFQAAKRLAVLDAEHEGLVFGRLDLREEEHRYIGRIGVRDDDYEPLVIDWRAPAAEPFYRATANNPMDVIRRRVLRCRNDKVIGIEDDLLDDSVHTDLPVIGEGALMAALSRARGHQMKDIVATIQAQQDEAIRAPYQGVTVIAGGPGTGKTVVALHRAAYLLYSNRKRLEKGGVLVVGPSTVFMNYIERVLPSLGEDSVTLKSIGSVASDVLRTAVDRVDGAEAATLKGSLRMLPLLKRLVASPMVEYDEALQVRVSVKGEVLTLKADKLRRMRSELLATHRNNKSREVAEQAVVNSLWSRFPADEHDIDRDQFEELVTSQASFQMAMNAWWPKLSAPRVLARCADAELLGRAAGDLLDERERRVLADSFATTVGGDEDDERSAGWSVADIALLDELVSIIGPSPRSEEREESLFIEGGEAVQELVTTADILRDEREESLDDEPHNTFAHVLVDEAQDITPMQWRMLRRRGPQASWTLVGDPAQSSWPVPAETEQVMKELIGSAPHRTFRLTKNYRSPAEVFDLAAKVITPVFPEADLPEAVRSTGNQPVLAVTDRDGLMDALGEQVATLAEQVDGTIGIIVPPNLMRQVRRNASQQQQIVANLERCVVVTPLESKGLEYDGVLVVSPDDIVEQTPGRERVLYVALTRPTQRLTILDVDGKPGAWRRAL